VEAAIEDNPAIGWHSHLKGHAFSSLKLYVDASVGGRERMSRVALILKFDGEDRGWRGLHERRLEVEVVFLDRDHVVLRGVRTVLADLARDGDRRGFRVGSGTGELAPSRNAHN
jgi:hypothetical protein